MAKKNTTRKPKKTTSKKINRINHSLNKAYAAPEVNDTLEKISEIKCFLHKTRLSTVAHHTELLSMMPGFVEEEVAPYSKSKYYFRFRNRLPDSNELILKGSPKNKRQPSRSSVSISPAGYASHELLSQISEQYSKNCSGELKVSAVEFGIDIFTSDPYGLFLLFKKYLRVLYSGENVKLYQEENRNHTLYAGDVAVYMRGEGRAKGKGWKKEECNRLRIEVRAKRYKINNDLLGVSSLDDLLQKVPFLAAFRSNGKFKLLFQVAKFRPTKVGKLPLPGNPWEEGSLMEAIQQREAKDCSNHLEDFYPMQKLQKRIEQAIVSFEKEWNSLYNNTQRTKKNTLRPPLQPSIATIQPTHLILNTPSQINRTFQPDSHLIEQGHGSRLKKPLGIKQDLSNPDDPKHYEPPEQHKIEAKSFESTYRRAFSILVTFFQRLGLLNSG